MSTSTALLWAVAAYAASTIVSPSVTEVWLSEGYGYVVVAAPDNVKVYDLAADRCSLSDTVPSLSALGTIERTGPDGFVLAGETSRIAFHRINSLPAACVRPAAKSVDPVVNFDALWTIFAQHYPAFAERGADWQALRATYRPRVEALGETGDPWLVFTDMLGRLHDPHVHLSDGERRFQARRGDASPIGPIQQSLMRYLESAASPLVGGVNFLAHDRLAWGVTADNVGYLAVMTMGGFSAGPIGWPGNTTAASDRAAAHAALATALSRLGSTRGLVLDVRFNPGGSEEIADLIAGCFADRQRLAYMRKARDGTGFGPSFPAFAAPNDCPRFNRPVVVLVGERTTSAAEALVMRLRVLPQVVTVGQPTQGAHSDVLNKTLPNGWKLGLSNEVYTLADGHVYEGVGIPPTVATPAATDQDTDDVRFGRDIRLAVAEFRKQPL